ncbi:uncharacterized protein LOC103828250 [Brassica rapa]|uniref:uncharacterized protein LOC103828250 n=1 Tax=Brassica campestris TaxID=3711 RepID=UPI00142D5A8F|nr:uncharacterized protein LOC103828250 [Brassica rapa]
MLQLRPILKDYMHCDIGNGEAASFWFDSWTSLGPLIDFTGQGGPRSLRIRKGANVNQASTNGSWTLPAARSNAIQTIQEVITTIDPPNSTKGTDTFKWRKSDGTFGPIFSSKVTWEFLQQPSPTVFWSKDIWLKENIPRNSFVASLALLRRLPTKDRLLHWGLNVSWVVFSARQVWKLIITSSLSVIIPPLFSCLLRRTSGIHAAAAWILQPHPPANHNASVLMKLIFQSIIYIVWKERNTRIFTAVSTSAQGLHLQLDRLLRDRILSLPARLQPASSA